MMFLGVLFLPSLCGKFGKISTEKSCDNLENDPNISLKNIMAYTSEICDSIAVKPNLLNGYTNTRLISWSPPIVDGVKLNTDGCLYESTKKAGYGGLFGNHQGQCYGYYGKLECNSSLETEIWAIYRGRTIMIARGYSNIRIESDSSHAVQLITDGPNDKHPLFAMITDARMLLARTFSALSHISREANQSADHLAHMGAEQTEALVVTEDS